MSVMMITAKIRPDKVAEVERAVQRVLEVLADERPPNVRYASLKRLDGATFVALVEVADGTRNPLPSITAFRDFQEQLGEWVEGSPETGQLEVVGSYRLFEAPLTAPAASRGGEE